jgi:hypothetical protein
MADRFGSNAFMRILNSFILVAVGCLSAGAQTFTITSATLSNDVLQISFPGRADSYYFLHSQISMSVTSPPVSALLGSVGSLVFNSLVTGSTRFFRVEQIPLSSTNSLLGDGIPDGWKLQNGLDPFDPSVTNQVPFGDTQTWLQVYQTTTSLAALPLAYFPTPSTTVVVGATNVTVQVAFTKPFSGTLNYQVSGSALADVNTPTGPAGDYIPPTGYITNLQSALAADISIALTPVSAVEVDRTLLVALSYQSNAALRSYTITTKTSVEAIHIVQSTQGVFVGTLGFTNGVYATSKGVKMALRSGAFFDVTGDPLLGDSFTVLVNSSASGFQLNNSSFTRQITNTPWGRPLNLNLTFGATITNTAAINDTNAVFVTPVSLTVNGLTGSGRSVTGYGTLTLSRAQ